MARLEQHEKESIELFGKPFTNVHKFLDQFAKKYGWSHRRILHHTYGVEMVRFFFGNKEAEVAKQHIRTDCNNEIPTPEDWLNSNFWLNTGEIFDD